MTRPTDPEAFLSAASASVPDALAFLQSIVEMETPTESKSHVDRVGAVLAERLTQLGFDVARDRQEAFGDHVVGRRQGAQGGPTVMLIGHFDTVYPLGTLDAQRFEIRDDTVSGPGALDMKGGITVMLYAIRVLDAVAGAAAPSLLVVLNSDEEPGSPTSRPLIERLAREVDVALVFEPGVPGASVTTGRKGVGIFHVEVEGVSAHAGAEPEKGASAIHELAAIITTLVDAADPEIGTTVNVGAVSGGRLPYVVADAASAAIDVRVPSTAEANRIRSAFAAAVASPSVPGTTATLRGSFHRPPFESDAEHPLWELAVTAGAHAGLALRRHTTGGASDANNVSAAGIPTLDGLGPDGRGAHGATEHFLLDTFHRKMAMAALILDGLGRQRVHADVARRETT